MSDLSVIKDNEVLEVPAFGKSPALKLEMGKIREGERRIIEAKLVNPSTYAELESAYNEAYRDLRRHLANIGYGIAMAEKALEEAKAEILLNRYPEFMKDRPKSQDNADLRKAYMSKDPEYQAAYDRVAQLKALEANFDGKVKVFERVCAYMKKRMDLIIRSGLSSEKLY